MSDHSMTLASDASSVNSFDLAPDSPLTLEKTRLAHANWVLEVEQRPEFKLLEPLLHPHNVDIEDAITRLVDLTHAAAQDESIGNHCWMTACSVLEAACRTPPDQQGRLVTFLLALSAVAIMDSSTGEPWMFEDGQGVVWRDLPTFGYTIADEMGAFDGREQGYTGEEAERWENLTAFLAQVDAGTEEPGSVLDFSLSWAATAFAWAFEGGAEAGAPSELAVRLACIWLVYDAQKLWSRVGDSGNEQATLERWTLWRQGLDECQVRLGDGTTPELITHALAQMKRVQGSS